MVENYKIPVHKCILSSRCNYFNSAFCGEMQLISNTVCLISFALIFIFIVFFIQIQIEGCKYEPFIAMIEYLYSGKLNKSLIMIIR